MNYEISTKFVIGQSVKIINENIRGIITWIHTYITATGTKSERYHIASNKRPKKCFYRQEEIIESRSWRK
jgi:hypothetical protein